MTLFGELLARTGLPANFFESMTRDDRAARRRVSPARLLTGLPRITAFLWRHARAGPAIEAFLDRHDRRARTVPRRRLAQEPLDSLIGEIRRLQDLHGDSQWYVFVGAMNMTVRSKLLQRFSRRHAPEVAPADLTRGLVGLKSLEPNIELRRMAAGAVQVDAPARVVDEQRARRGDTCGPRHVGAGEGRRQGDGRVPCAIRLPRRERHRLHRASMVGGSDAGLAGPGTACRGVGAARNGARRGRACGSGSRSGACGRARTPRPGVARLVRAACWIRPRRTSTAASASAPP